MLVDNDAVDERRLERENTLNTDIVTDLANGETLRLTLAVDFNHHTTVLLDTLLVTLLDAGGSGSGEQPTRSGGPGCNGFEKLC